MTLTGQTVGQDDPKPKGHYRLGKYEIFPTIGLLGETPWWAVRQDEWCGQKNVVIARFIDPALAHNFATWMTANDEKFEDALKTICREPKAAPANHGTFIAPPQEDKQ